MAWILSLAAAILVVRVPAPAQTPLGTAFTYQGRIKQNGVLVNGTCDICFKLYDVAVGGTAIAQDSHIDVQVGNGLFVVPDVDFGPGAFAGDALWIEVSACCGNPGCNDPCTNGVVVSPRQPLTAIPYAAHALGPWELDSSNGNLFYLGGNVSIGTPFGAGVGAGVLELWTDTSDNSHGLAWHAAPIGSSSARAYLTPDGQGDTTWHLDRGGNPAMGISINANGDVGIGTSSPVSRLHVMGNQNVSGVRFETSSPNGLSLTLASPDTVTADRCINLEHSGVLPDWQLCAVAEDERLQITNQGGGAVMMINQGGHVGIGVSPSRAKLHVLGSICATGGVNCPSDARFKRNIARIGEALAKVSAMTGVSYQWNVEAYPMHVSDGRPQLGLIGQEVAEVVPEAVSRDDDGFYYVAYDQLVPVLVEAVKELSGTVQDNESRLAAQRKLIDRQYELIQDLAGRVAALESAAPSR